MSSGGKIVSLYISDKQLLIVCHIKIMTKNYEIM